MIHHFCVFLLIVLFWLTGFQRDGQHQYGKKESPTPQDYEITRAFSGDFDRDGKQDSVTIIEFLGSSTYGVEVTINDGEKNYTYYQEFTSGQFYNPVYADKEMFARFRTLFMDSVFRYPERDADPSLQWLMNGHCSKRFLTDSTFDLLITYTPVWSRKMTWPSSYNTSCISECTQRPDSAVLVVYIADRHYPDGRLPAAGTGNFYETIKRKGSGITILRTRHALVVKDKGKYSWVFINDENISEGPDKLIYSSVQDVYSSGDLIFFVQNNLGAKRIFMVNYKTGLCMRLNAGLYGNGSLSGIQLNDRDLVISTEGAAYQVGLEKLRQAELTFRSR